MYKLTVLLKHGGISERFIGLNIYSKTLRRQKLGVSSLNTPPRVQVALICIARRNVLDTSIGTTHRWGRYPELAGIKFE